MNTKYRSLSDEEIGRLTEQGCSCDNWAKVQVAERFDPAKIRSTHFSGNIKLGLFEKEVSFFGGLKKSTGISHATLFNCTIGDNAYINQIKNYIANYVIEDDVIIENVDLLAVEGESSFGNGTEVIVLNEAGGREIPIYDHLSAQMAYVLALYRHQRIAIENLKQMINRYTATVTSSMGRIGKHARLINCQMIKNAKIGTGSVIEGADRLENCSINSCTEDPVYIGPGVIGENFIVCSGSKISDGTLIFDCFVGQGCELGKQYSAENSLFFANCAGFHGEACSLFAGPYTVTHHKSTLLIAGLFSFLNAGSGSNQSNHMYKLGPLHQGIVERGSKTTSDSYILWPAKVGPFTMVMGRHYRNSDTSDLPFSYLIESNDESILIPGVNLRSVGTIRDARKWPKRDKRKDPNKLDFINFYLLSPYTIQKMRNGRKLLLELKETSGETSDYFTYHSVKIKNSSLNKGIKFYEMGIAKFLGNCLIRRLRDKQFKNEAELRDALTPETSMGVGRWIDLVGLLAPDESVQKLLEDIAQGTISTPEQVTESFKTMHENYTTYEWAWASEVLQKLLGKKIAEITANDIIDLTKQWITAVIKLDNMLQADAKKEFSLSAQTGFGIDSDQEIRQDDFKAVRGEFEDNSFVADIKQHITTKTALSEDLIKRMKLLL